MVDIRERQTPQLQTTPTSQVKSSKVEGFQTREIIGEVAKAQKQKTKSQMSRLDFEQQAIKDANDVFVKDYQNQLDAMEQQARAELAEVSGVQAGSKRNEILERLNKQHNKMLESGNEDTKGALELANARSLNKFNGFGLMHEVRENEKYKDSVYKSASNFRTNDIVGASLVGKPQTELAIAKLDLLNLQYMKRKGHKAEDESTKFQIAQSRSNALVKAVEKFKSMGASARAKDFVKQWDAFILDTDKTKVAELIGQAEEADVYNRALAINEEARLRYKNNLEQRRVFIEEQTKGKGKLSNLALAMEKSNRQFDIQERDIREKTAMGEAKEFIRTKKQMPPQSMLEKVAKDERDEVENYLAQTLDDDGRLTPTDWEVYNELRDKIERGDRVIMTSGISHANGSLNDDQRKTLQKMWDRKRQSIQSKKEDIALKSMRAGFRDDLSRMVGAKGLSRKSTGKKLERYNTFMSVADEIYNDVSEEMAKKGVIDPKDVEAEVRKKFSVQVQQGIPEAEVFRKKSSFLRFFDEEKKVSLSDAEIIRLETERKNGEREAIFDIDSIKGEDERVLQHIEKTLTVGGRPPSREVIQRAFDNYKLDTLKRR